MDNCLFTVPEVAEMLHCSTRYVYKLAKDGKLPAVKIGRKYLIPSDSFEQWIHNSLEAKNETINK